MSDSTTVRRAFADLASGQLHYRHGGRDRPLLLLHASPGSSKQLVPLIESLVSEFRVIAPDTPGNGDSAALPLTAPAITDFASTMLELLDVLGLETTSVYGSHTGASIAAEMAILAPDRIERVILDGIGVFSATERDKMLAHYAYPFIPDLEGAYLQRAFQFLRDQYLFYPWYDRTWAARRDGDLPAAGKLHEWLVELLKAAETYHLAYRAAFTWDAVARLPLVRQPTLVTAACSDPLYDVTEKSAGLPPNARFAPLLHSAATEFTLARTMLFTDFLKAPGREARPTTGQDLAAPETQVPTYG